MDSFEGDMDTIYTHMRLSVCPKCYWWRALIHPVPEGEVYEFISIMNKKHVSSDDIPIEELRNHLLKHWGHRKIISPKKCEQLVESVFKNYYNCEVHYNSNSVYSKDGGIDLIFVKKNEGVSAVIQVKRRQTDKPESVQCIREFIGSVAQSKYNHGYFVTTADNFTRDANIEFNNSIENLNQRNIELHLINGTHLFDLLTNCRMKTNGIIQLEDFLRKNKVLYWISRLDSEIQYISSEQLIQKIINNSC
jgi:hypothetical protein